MLLTNIYYRLKPIIPRRIQISLRRYLTKQRLANARSIWPIDKMAAVPPSGWTGWPARKQFALVLTHDVETERGLCRCDKLMKIERQFGFRSAFNFVPERYEVSQQLREDLTKQGFEVGVHGLKHDGKLYRSRRIFQNRAKRINQYLKKWNAVGFRSPAMHHNLQWLHALNIKYDASTFDTDPFEAQTDRVQTIFPFFVYADSTRKSYVELPYTLPQDFTIFVLMKEENIAIWIKKLDWIAKKGGMALLITHPDYMNFEQQGLKHKIDEYWAHYYVKFLDYIKKKYQERYWHALPTEIAAFWNSKMASHG